VAAAAARLDPVQQTTFGQTPIPTPLITFNGLDAAQGEPGRFPADASGAVGIGPNGETLYFQAVNHAYAFYNVSVNPPMTICGPFSTTNVWGSFPDTPAGARACAVRGGFYSDAVVLFDKLAQRWFISRFAQDQIFSSPTPLPTATGTVSPTATPTATPPGLGLWYQCFAISATADPLGPWYRYAFLIDSQQTGADFNDYPKFGIWMAQDGSNSAYYMNSNANKIMSATGVIVAAFERNVMLAGLPNQPAQIVTQFVTEPQTGPNPPQFMMLPADFDGTNLPPAGAGAYFVESRNRNLGFPGDELAIWQFQVNWSNVFQSSFTPLIALPAAAFNANLCNEYPGGVPNAGSVNQACIPQPNPPAPTPTAVPLDSTSYGYMMYRLAYRNFLDHEALVLNQTVDVGDFPNHAGVRWYELRRSATAADCPGGSPGAWCIYQQSTYAPDTNHRWQGTLAMDSAGNIALGFNAASAGLFPGLRYVGRQAGGPLGVMTSTEGILQAGGGSQLGPDTFWADYSQMTINPRDDCTFWHVGSFQPTTVNFAWSTSISAFRFSNCASPTPTATATPIVAPATQTAIVQTATVQALTATATPTIHPGTATAIVQTATIQALTATATPTIHPGTQTAVVQTATVQALTATATPTIHPGTATAIVQTATVQALTATATPTIHPGTQTAIVQTATIQALTATATPTIHPLTATALALTGTPTPSPTLARAPTAPPNQPPLGGTPGVPAVRAVGQTVQYTPGGANGVSGSWTKTGSGSFVFTATNTSPAIVPGSIPAITIPTTAGNEAGTPRSGPTVCTAVGATPPFTTTCQGTTVGDVLLGAPVTVTFATLGSGTVASIGIPVVVAASPTPVLVLPLLPLLPPLPPLAPPLALPPPPLPLLPVPQMGAPPGGLAAAEVPVIPEANVAVLLLTGLIALASLATWRRRS
jgi:hypothetical protein